MASLELVDRILTSMDNGDTPIGIFLDLLLFLIHVNDLHNSSKW